MSSISINGSGQRSLSMTVNDEQRTAASMPTKTDDNLHVSFHGRETRLIVPTNARLERIKKGESEYLRLVMRNGTSLFIDSEADDTPGHWPNMSVSAGKHISDTFADAEVVEVVHEEVGVLIPPTEPEA